MQYIQNIISYFLFLFIAFVYFAQEYIPLDLQSRGIYILARNNVSEVLKPLLTF